MDHQQSFNDTSKKKNFKLAESVISAISHECNLRWSTHLVKTSQHKNSFYSVIFTNIKLKRYFFKTAECQHVIH